MSMYTKQPGLLRKDFSWQQSNAIIEDGIARLGQRYVINVSYERSPIESRRIDTATVNGDFFTVVLRYVPRDGKIKAAVRAELTPKENTDSEKIRELEEVVRTAI